MNAPSPLAHLRVASPCLARWSDMSGDERVRFCGQCRKHVYNLSSMTSDEASALIQEKEGKLCARFYQRSDGSVLTADCPVGVARTQRRTRRFAVAAALGLLLGGGVLAAGNSSKPGAGQGRNRLSQAWSATVWKVKGWLGIQPPPRMTMGDICVAPAVPAAVPTSPTTSAPRMLMGEIGPIAPPPPPASK